MCKLKWFIVDNRVRTLYNEIELNEYSEEGHYRIAENQEFGIMGTGETREHAIECARNQLRRNYKLLIDTPDKWLNDTAIDIKNKLTKAITFSSTKRV